LSTLTVGSRSYEVAKVDKTPLSAELKARDDAQTTLQADRDGLAKELATKTLTSETRAAMDTIGGFKPQAYDAVNAWVEKRFALGKDLKAYKPDIEASTESSNGDPLRPTLDDEGNQVTIESDLREVVASGIYAGSWTEEPGGMPRGSHPTAMHAPDDQSAGALISRGVRDRMNK
jgi:hypothetical protein